MKILISSIVIIIIGVVVYLELYQPNILLNEDEAVSLLTDRIVSDSLYDSFTTLQCLDFNTSETTKEYFEFSVYEIHGDGCKGDPNTYPKVDTFKVMRRTKDIFYIDFRNGSYLPYDPTSLKR